MHLGRIAVGVTPISVLAMFVYLAFPKWDARPLLFALAVCLGGLALLCSILGLVVATRESRGASIGLWSSVGTLTWACAVFSALAPWLVVALTVSATLAALVIALVLSRSPYPNERLAQSLAAGSLLFGLAVITLRTA